MPTALHRGVRLQIHQGQGASRVQPQGALDDDLQLPAGWVVMSLDGISDRIHLEQATAFSQRIATGQVVVSQVPSSLMSFWAVLAPPPLLMVASFYAPYLCARCHMRFEVLIDRRVHSAALQAGCTPQQRCASCGGPSACLGEAGFLSVVSSPLPPWPDAVHALLGQPSSSRSGLVEAQLLAGPSPRAVAVWLPSMLSVPDEVVTHLGAWPGPVLWMAGQVVSTDDRSVDALKAVLSTMIEPWWVGITAELAQVLSMTLHGFGRSQVASVRLPFRCASCGTVVLHISSDQIERLLVMTCPTCAAVLQPAFQDRVVMMLHTIPMAVPPPHVAAAMARATEPPSVQHARAWTEYEPPRLSQLPVADVPSPSRVPVEGPAAPEGGSSRFEIIRRLGVGGMAETMLGRQLGIGGFEKRVVIKQILPELAVEPAFVDMFLHEARVAARINHSNVVQMFDFGRANDQYYIVMEYVRGHDLAAVMRTADRQHAAFPIELAVRVVIDLCAGLSAAHSALDDHGHPDPIIHRDVSPHNVLVSADGLVKLADFGIARVTSQGGLTTPGQLKGKILYMAPETLRNEPPTTKIDIYAAGLMLYTLLAGKHPYNRGNDVQNMYAVAHEQLPSILTIRREVPFSLAAVIGRAVHRDPSQRFANAQTMQLHLENFLAEWGQPATATHLALWVNQLMTDEQHSAPHEATPSSSMALLELGQLHPPDAERTRVVDGHSLTKQLSIEADKKQP
jgi:serine/threonine protein kinase/DNA-directed RNA polymerase subunit RPC12/RpoP